MKMFFSQEFSRMASANTRPRTALPGDRHKGQLIRNKEKTDAAKV